MYCDILGVRGFGRQAVSDWSTYEELNRRSLLIHDKTIRSGHSKLGGTSVADSELKTAPTDLMLDDQEHSPPAGKRSPFCLPQFILLFANTTLHVFSCGRRLEPK